MPFARSATGMPRRVSTRDGLPLRPVNDSMSRQAGDASRRNGVRGLLSLPPYPMVAEHTPYDSAVNPSPHGRVGVGDHKPPCDSVNPACHLPWTHLRITLAAAADFVRTRCSAVTALAMRLRIAPTGKFPADVQRNAP